MSQKFEFPNKIINRLLLTRPDPHNGETARLHLRFNIVSNFLHTTSLCTRKKVSLPEYKRNHYAKCKI